MNYKKSSVKLLDKFEKTGIIITVLVFVEACPSGLRSQS